MINVSGWGEFDCKDLFECKNTGNILARDVIDGSGNTPYVTASGYNNGVVAHIDASNYEIIKGHCILVGGKTFTITYQKDDFVSNDSHNFTVRVKKYDISDLNYLYLVSLIYTYFGQKYSWNDAVTKDKLMAEKIPLPVTSTGQPDWAYMETYMKQIMEKSEKSLENLKRADDTKQQIDVNDWGEFKVGDLFDIHPTKAYKVTNADLLSENGVNPVVANSGFNNGIVGFSNFDCTEKAGVITFTDTAAKSSESFFYQIEDFIGYPHVQGMYCKVRNLNKYEGKFIATVMRSAAGKFDFIIKMTREEVSKFTIKLPITQAGEPDWQYMENYMKNIMEKSEKSISILNKYSA